MADARIFLTRHGEMETYDSGTPLRQHGISSLGEVQSTLFAERLAERSVDLKTDASIVSGPSVRHVETAELVSDTLESIRGEEVEITVLDGLDDARWGTDALRSAGERSFNQQEWAQSLVDASLPVEESFKDVRERVLTVFREIAVDEGVVVIVITSFIVVAIAIATVLDSALDPPRFLVNNAGLTELLVEGDDRLLIQMNSTAHLPGRLETTSWQDY